MQILIPFPEDPILSKHSGPSSSPWKLFATKYMYAKEKLVMIIPLLIWSENNENIQESLDHISVVRNMVHLERIESKML